MLDSLTKLLGWTNGQKQSFALFRRAIRSVFSGKRVLAGLIAATNLFGASVFKLPVHPYGDAPDLTGYTLTVFDDFNGDALNSDLWYFRGAGSNRCGYRAESQISVENGNLVLTGEYLDTGAFGAGWYAGAVALREWKCKGYFEIRCKCNKGVGFWSAFWMQSEHSYDAQSKGGVGGAEIDIFEATDYDAFLPRMRDRVTQTVYCNGSDDDEENIDKCQFGALGKNIYDEYNTYSVLWNDDEYIFYINGKETYRTSFGLGVSQVPENLIVSLELPETMPDKVASNHDHKTQMIVDWVKVYEPVQMS